MMAPALTLANTPLDLQITICILLHPSDILALRKTCKALELATRKRIVWVTVLHRVCLDNTLFLPSFPIPDMSDLELERAAMAPRRWIELCRAFQRRNSNDYSSMLHPRTTRTIKDTTVNSLFIVPGGRYLVTAGNGLCVWDLGYVSTVDCKSVASVGLGDDFEFCMVQVTPDGKGLVILSTHSSNYFSIFEIYPQSEIPLLTEIAQLESFSSEEPAHLLPDTLIFCAFRENWIVFRVVDYRTNYSICFSADADVSMMGLYDIETFATETAIIVFCKEGILIWAIPPLSPQSSGVPDGLLDINPIHTMPPLFKIPLPDGIARHIHEIRELMTVSSWYFGSWESIYFDIIYTDSKLQRFKVIIKPDLSDASLHFINMSEIISDDFMKSLRGYRHCEGYGMCEDALVYFWNDMHYSGLILTSAPFANVITRWNGYIDSICPSSGRYVYTSSTNNNDESLTGNSIRIVVADLF